MDCYKETEKEMEIIENETILLLGKIVLIIIGGIVALLYIASLVQWLEQ
jgi:hypothetical protein